MQRTAGFVLALSLATCAARAQQVPDTLYSFPIQRPMYASGRGPVILVDEAHFNFHTAEGRYRPFANVLQADGYRVQASKSAFSVAALAGARILVVANALAERNRADPDSTDWSLPNPSAFADSEIASVRTWVRGGGSLLLIADHMPFPGAASDLAAAFGVHFSNGFALDSLHMREPMMFRRSDGSLAVNSITGGQALVEKIDSVATFTGSAFRADPPARPLLVLGPRVLSYLPAVAWQIDAKTPRIPVGAWLQGAALRSGKGRVAVFGEAAMFSAQLQGPQGNPMGMNAKFAVQNPQFLLNIIHWLAGLGPDK